jgi:sigma-B regulation protein RsbU (phosphoserine phosphatase)
MTATPRILLFDAAPRLATELTQRLVERGLSPTRLGLTDALAAGVNPTGGDVAVVLVDPQAAAEQKNQLTAVLQRLADENVASLVCGAEAGLRREGGPLVEWLEPEVGLDEVAGKVSTLARYAPLVKGLERELHYLHRLGEQFNRYFSEIDQEMRLAGRLQRDFLPRDLADVPQFQFQALYRPASWVSGDLYDVFRIDEQLVGILVADAMGHGVSAGLLTMFLRQALTAKEIAGHSYAVPGPAATLESLHTCLVRQKLPNSQFVTAAYAVLDLAGRELRLARAGLPYPLHVRPDGSITELRSAGTLLGLADVPAEFEETRVLLRPGDKVVFYTDGLEDVIAVPAPTAGEPPEFTQQLRDWAKLGAADFIRAVGDHLDCREGSLHPADDSTMLVLEVAPTTDR